MMTSFGQAEIGQHWGRIPECKHNSQIRTALLEDNVQQSVKIWSRRKNSQEGDENCLRYTPH